MDHKQRVKRFTREAVRLINFIDSDIGRPIDHISHHLEYEDLTKRIQEVLDTLTSFEDDELEVRVQERTAELRKEIEKRMKFEEALKASSKKLVDQYLKRKALSHKLVELLEKDRKEIAMTLHDEVGSVLTAARMEIEAMESEVAESPILDKVATAKGLIVEAMGTVRDMSSHMRPMALDHFGLISALEPLTEEVRKRSGIKIAVHAPREGLPERLSPGKELALYRIVQESLTNAVRHAEATEVFITLSSRDDTICLSVEDNGKGFSYEGLDKKGGGPGHMGISIMRERVTEFDGKFRVESSPGKGTQVMVELPIN